MRVVGWMRLSLIALGLLAVACGPAVARSSDQGVGPDEIAPKTATPVALASLAPSATPLVTSAPATVAPTVRVSTPAPTPIATLTPVKTVAPATAAPTAVAGFDPTRYIGQGDAYNCGNFSSQAQAQAVLRADPREPNRLDGNDNDGLACEGNNAPFDLTPVVRR